MLAELRICGKSALIKRSDEMEKTLLETTAARALVDQLIANGVEHVLRVPGESYLWASKRVLRAKTRGDRVPQ